MVSVELTTLNLPDFGLPTVEPSIPAETYEKRIETLQNLQWWSDSDAQSAATSALIVYGDREHAANLTYLTGFDPRFEEALLILVKAPNSGTRKPILVVGNEGWGYTDISPLKFDKVLYQNFSLLGQPRGNSPSIETILSEAGINKGTFVGVVGWKYFSEADSADYQHWSEIPSYIVDTLRNITGSSQFVYNANHLLMNADSGLRTINDVDQLAVFEFAATHSSQSIRNVLFGLKPGMTEYGAMRLMGLNGMPLSAHPMLSTGSRAAMGLPSPSMRVIEQGDPFTMALGLWGALNARAGFVVHGANELPSAIQDYAERLVFPYFRAVTEWYTHVGIGVTGSELYEVVHKYLGDSFFAVGLNPGHLIHLDEWLHSPIYKGSTIPLKSGMALQVDIIPATGTAYFTTNIEDGIALADADLRATFAQKYPEAWGRIQARRQFMENTLGIPLKPEVLPFSNIPAYLPPYLLNPRQAMRVKLPRSADES
jgi:hypothetical protein